MWMPHLILGILGVWLFLLKSANTNDPRLALRPVLQWISEVSDRLRKRFG